MLTPDFKGKKNVTLDDKEVPLYEAKKTDTLTIIGLRTSELLLIAGFLLVFLNNVGIFAPGTYFGAFSWVMVVVFSIGLTINFVMIPYLYFSSFKNFQKENYCWDRETFLILPSFFFGTFFLYGSKFYLSWIILVLSIMVISVVHYKFLRLSWKLLLRSSNEAFLMQQEYFLSLKYLTVYYFLLLASLILFNPLQQMFIWIRTNV